MESPLFSQSVVDRFSALGKIGNIQALELVPKSERWYKCFTCHTAFPAPEGELKCPGCGEIHIVQACPLEHCRCKHEVEIGNVYCPLCGEAVCPACGSHDVVQISRVTGYLQDVSGWNAGKRQELKDRVRYDVGGA
jgi:hypothetical protein